MSHTNFSKNLKSIRLNAGKTVQEVSAHLTSLGFKAAVQTVYGWERGVSQPTPDVFLEMCSFYEVTNIFYSFGYSSVSLDLTRDESNLIQGYRSLDPRGQSTVRATLEHELQVSRRGEADKISHGA